MKYKCGKCGGGGLYEYSPPIGSYYHKYHLITCEKCGRKIYDYDSKKKCVKRFEGGE